MCCWPRSLNTPAVSGADALAFSAGTPSALTLASGATATIDLTFAPDSAGAKSASLSITSSSNGSVDVPLSGTGLPGIVTPASIEFGSVTIGTPSTASLTIANGNPTEVTLTPPFTISGDNAAEFSVGTPGAITLAGGAETTAVVTFLPAGLGPRSASLVVTSANGGTRTVSLSGLAICPLITVTGSLPAGEFGFAYSQTFTASGGSGPYTFRVSAGTTPAGLGLDPSGVLSGTPGALGTFTFTVEAQTANGCTGTADFVLTILDTTPPALTLPGDLTATATSPAGAVVSFAASAVDLVDGSRPVVCIPASGATFPIGATTVACTASDAHGNAASGGFRVTVTEPVQAGRMVGDGRIEAGTTRHDFDFVVQERATGADAGRLRYRVKSSQSGRDREDRFDAIATRAVFFNVGGISPGRQPASGVDTVLFTGVGLWNSAGGYTFEARAIDAGEPGRGLDRFAITVRDAAGRIVASLDDALDDGNIDSLRIGR